MKKKESFVLYSENKEIFENLSAEDAKKLIIIIFNYVESGVAPQLCGELRFAFIPIRQQLDRDAAKWRDVILSRVSAGSKGGLAKKQSVANVANASFANQKKQSVANVANASFANQKKQNVANVAVHEHEHEHDINNINIINNNKEKSTKKEKRVFCDFVFLADEEFEKLQLKFGVDFTARCIEKLANTIGVDPKLYQKKYKSHYHVILKWVSRAVEDDDFRINKFKNGYPQKKTREELNNERVNADLRSKGIFSIGEDSEITVPAIRTGLQP